MLLLFTTGAGPFNYLNVADCGDVYVTPYDLKQTATEIYEQFKKLVSTGCKTLAIGGDHTITYPILKAYKVCMDNYIQLHTPY